MSTNIDPTKATLLGGEGLPPDEIDLAKPVDEQTFRKGMLVLFGRATTALEELAHHGSRGMMHHAIEMTRIADTLDGFVGKLDAFGVIDDPMEGDAPDVEANPNVAPAQQAEADGPSD